MSLYPSLEDMKASELIRAQVDAMTPQVNHIPPNNQYNDQYVSSQPNHHYPSIESTNNEASAPMIYSSSSTTTLSLSYPSLREFMGLELTEEMIRLNMPEYLDMPTNNTVANIQPSMGYGSGIVAPISGSRAVIKSMVNHGVRQCTIVKSGSKNGLRVRAMNTGVFVCLVLDGSPAAKSGLRFGDQILQIDGVDMAGMTVEKVHAIFKKKNNGDKTVLAVRDRPFERSVTLVRDSQGQIGFQFKDGKIINIVKDSSAARNGLLTDHAMLEVNGKNVIGLKDKEITKIISNLEGNALTVTVMPSFLYKHMVKEMDTSLFGRMDHSDI